MVSAEGQWETLAVNELDTQIFASPAIADERLYVRARETTFAFGTEEKQRRRTAAKP